MRIVNMDVTYNGFYESSVDLQLRDVDGIEMNNLALLAKSGSSVTIVPDSPVEWEPCHGHKGMFSSTDIKFISFLPIDLKVTKVIYHNPATIVFWSDGTKTVVKCDKNDTYDPEKGFYIACAKKLFGNNYKAVGRINKALEMAVTKGEGDEKKC